MLLFVHHISAGAGPRPSVVCVCDGLQVNIMDFKYWKKISQISDSTCRGSCKLLCFVSFSCTFLCALYSVTRWVPTGKNILFSVHSMHPCYSVFVSGSGLRHTFYATQGCSKYQGNTSTGCLLQKIPETPQCWCQFHPSRREGQGCLHSYRQGSLDHKKCQGISCK